MPKLDLTFAHHWTAEILPARPLILPRRQFVYPRYAEEVERGALEVVVHPAEAEPFLATFALGFSDPLAPTGLWSSPNPDWLCAVSGGYAYMVNITQPEQFEHIEYKPVLEVRALLDQQLLLFTSHHALLAWGAEGKKWQTARLSWEGVQIARIEGQWLYGTGWDLRTDRDVPFRVNLETGEHTIEAA
jgi:hypothetical protein